MIPYGRQSISDEDVAAVVATLRSDFLTQGPAVPAFEKSIAEYCGVAHAVAVNSATSALHIACMALGLGPGDLLWTVPNTFVASANAARFCGADVDFVDIAPGTWNICVQSLAEKLAQAERAGRLPKVVVPVAFAGLSCDMRAIRALSDRYGFAVLEDASHAIGGRYRDKPVGHGDDADITVFSFHPVKIVTTAEGGLATTRHADLAEKMRLNRSHGITRERADMTRPDEGPWYYEQLTLGYNYRMTELQASLGLSQIKRLDEFVSRRHEIARRYAQKLAHLPLSPQDVMADAYSALHLYPVRLHATERRRAVFEGMRAAGIGVNVHYIPVHMQPYYQALGFREGDFPQAEAYYAGALSLPMYPDLTESMQDQVVAALENAL
ncbi:UDP-4-amino-4,6-dideoxy-N-acetyl-beta-L-altrosamine transaminase [Pandoraea bronchicola]|uniref:UDP-4-amino-4, 6-dideoxy-N-acetyl-beta-L-altrosamine transaminase n=1 Tax=Pandoraea bronchicola TaxID=2508287 RepID=A0A5E5BRT2_9BURK|nr:UDP-4-amino-4,6-dideoxy-N-acetyl-beta-L-altrosamine transaminase [Pandoraea bronchicola]VVE89031.1 UDP-4-amino-4, 6-dideoxy-N-acetyl-beta-L-altrosamine transaminase [Pandoraea bronchicola]